ncbi:MAG: bifunctional precorrin-2 dehydrogenase/sirohydrochlorin ferrochelatase [Nitrospinota bacterium]|nr:bifunctional precorrin-2 dehydrogenase/sirohydrochlorin ferrochelatase [Nitrospinota bacterium]
MYLPILLNLKNKKILVVGGGDVALRKVKTLKQFTENITVVGTIIDTEIKGMVGEYYEKDYNSSFLDGHFLVYVCTDNKELNQQIKREANKLGLLVNVVDNRRLCDFISPALYTDKEMVVAVSSNGKNTLKAIRWRDRIKEIFKKE